MKVKGKIIFCIISMIIASIALTTATYAWLASGKRSGNIIFVTGEVRYTLSGNLENLDTIVPNQSLIDDTFTNKITITNGSSIDSEIRIQILYQFYDRDSLPTDDGWEIFDADSITPLDSANDKKLVGKLSSTDSWEYTDGYWYYPSIISLVEDAPPATIDIITELYCNGDACGNEECANKSLIVKIILHAKQAFFVEWNELGEATFQ